MIASTPGPTLMGIDVIWVATILSGVAAAAVVFAIYAAVSVRDPMAKRVKALNDRREQLKAGITASTSKRRAKLVQKSETADRVRDLLSSLKMLQDEQVRAAQQKLLQAGIRKKDWAIGVIFGRVALPLVIGGFMVLWVYGLDAFPTWGPIKRYGIVAASFLLSYKAPDIYLKNLINKRSDAIRKGLPDALDLLVTLKRRRDHVVARDLDHGGLGAQRGADAAQDVLARSGHDDRVRHQSRNASPGTARRSRNAVHACSGPGAR